MAANLKQIVQRYKADSESVYNTWFIDNETLMKAFRSIRRGVGEVIRRTGRLVTTSRDRRWSVPVARHCVVEQEKIYLICNNIKKTGG